PPFWQPNDVIGLRTTVNFQRSEGQPPVFSAPGFAHETDLISKFQLTEFTRVNRVGELPRQVASAITEMVGGRELADPEHLQRPAAGQKAAEEPHLIFAGKSRTLWVVHFTRGGQAGPYELAIFELDPKGHLKD